MADDQASVREGLVVLLDMLAGIDVVGSAANGQQALDLLAALRAGARSYLTKDADRSAIVQALLGAASGLSVLSPPVHTTLLSAAGAAATPPAASGEMRELPAGLTRREAEILTMIARGMTSAEIAQVLVISNHTVKTHINRIFAKTGSANRTEASRFAAANGLS